MKKTLVSAALLASTPADSASDAMARDSLDHAQKGIASYYHDSLHGRKTASGQTYNKNRLSAAHKTLPLGTQTAESRTPGPDAASSSRSMTAAPSSRGASSTSPSRPPRIWASSRGGREGRAQGPEHARAQRLTSKRTANLRRSSEAHAPETRWARAYSQRNIQAARAQKEERQDQPAARSAAGSPPHRPRRS